MLHCLYTQLYVMYCLTNICYVCLEKKNNLISSVDSSVSVNKELRRIIGYHAFYQPWLKTKRIILTCEECYSLLRKTYQFLKMWHKNSALLKDYIDLLNTTTMPNTGNEAELHVHVNIKQTDINDVKHEVKLEDEHIYTFQWEHHIEETEDALVNFEDSFVKEENIWKREEVDDAEECPMVNNSTEIIAETNDVFVDLEDNKRIRKEVNSIDNNSTESIDNESNSEISLSDNSHLTNADGVSSGFAGKQMHATKKDDLNAATKKSYKCSTCSKSFITKTELNIHTRIHADKKSYECAICKKRFTQKASLVIHMRLHTVEKPYECTTCKKRFITRSKLVVHMRIHTGEKPYECTMCKKCYTHRIELVHHMRTHTGEKPYECDICKKCFSRHSNFKLHKRTHTGEKPYECATCKKCHAQRWHLVRHMRTHTGEKPYECTICKKSFASKSNLVSHMCTHSGEKPYECATCSKCFRHKSNVNIHMRNKHPDEEPH